MDERVNLKRFWPRQFGEKITKNQLIFDVIVGVVMPLLFFLFDRAVVLSVGPENSLLFTAGSIFTPFPQSLSIILILISAILILWLTLGGRSKLGRSRVGMGFVTGILLIGALCFFVSGLAFFLITFMLNFIHTKSIDFVVTIISVFIWAPPLLSGFVYLRNGIRAYHQALQSLGRRWLGGAMLLSVLLIVLIIGRPFIEREQSWKLLTCLFNCQKIDLSYANLNGIYLSKDLSYANLRQVNLSRALLVNADLGEVNLSGANLDHAVLSGVNLAGANLRGASLIDVSLYEVNLSSADLRGAKLDIANSSRLTTNDNTKWPEGHSGN
ncbi:MAG: pentapeptide repeat-containing protein [Caldilineaceae bacterium]